MGSTLGEVPDVAVVELLDLISAEFVDGRDEDRAAVDKAPFSDSVPMQLSDGTLLQMLLSSRDVMALGQILDDLLTDPA